MNRKIWVFAFVAAIMILGTDSYCDDKDASKPQSPPIEAGSGASASQVNKEVSSLKAKIIETQNKGRLGFNKIVSCKSVEGFGIYAPVESAQPISKLIFYVEPANYSTLISADRYIIDCSVDFQILDASGKPIISNENALKINRVSRSPILDLFFRIEMNLKSVKKLETMFVRVVLHDKIKNQSASANLKVKMEGGKPKPEEQI